MHNKFTPALLLTAPATAVLLAQLIIDNLIAPSGTSDGQIVIMYFIGLFLSGHVWKRHRAQTREIYTRELMFVHKLLSEISHLSKLPTSEEGTKRRFQLQLMLARILDKNKKLRKMITATEGIQEMSIKNNAGLPKQYIADFIIPEILPLIEGWSTLPTITIDITDSSEVVFVSAKTKDEIPLTLTHKIKETQ